MQTMRMTPPAAEGAPPIHGVWSFDLVTKTVRLCSAGSALSGYDGSNPRCIAIDEWKNAWASEDWSDLLARLYRPEQEEWCQVFSPAQHRGTLSNASTRIELRAVVERDVSGAYIRTIGSMREADPSPPCTVLLNRLLTEQALIEHARQPQASIDMCLAKAKFGVVRHDVLTDTIYWNENFSETADQASPDHRPTVAQWSALIHPEDRDLIGLEALQGATDSKPQTIAFRLIRPNGAIRHLQGKRTVSHDDSGTPSAATYVLFDMTEQWHSPNVNNQRRLNGGPSHALKDFLTHVSHELRTPLNVILGFAEILEADRAPALSEGQRKRVERIRTSGTHLLEMINDLLDLCRIEIGKLKGTLSPVDLLAELREALGLAARQASSRQVTMHLEPEHPPAGDYWVLGDGPRLRRAIGNLLGAAIKHNHYRGQVAINLVLEVDHVSLTVKIAEAGIGHQQLGGPLTGLNRQTHTDNAREGESVGITVARRFVESMGGSIHVNIQNSFLTEISVRMRRAAPSQVQCQVEPSEQSRLNSSRYPSPQCRVLYIEDHPVNRALVEGYVSLRPGVELEMAVDGESGIACAMRKAPDLILIDMRLPDLHGLQVIQRLRQLEPLKRVRCIAVSANAMQQQIDEATAAGFDGYLTKPVSMKLLLDELDRLS